jgi:hypothetical protein
MRTLNNINLRTQTGSCAGPAGGPGGARAGAGGGGGGAGGVRGGSGCLQWHWVNEWQWQCGSALAGWAVAVRSF